MSNFMLEPYVKADTFLTVMIRRQAEVLRGERGASALEYVGMVLVAAVIVGAVTTAISGAKITAKLGPAVDKILGAA